MAFYEQDVGVHIDEKKLQTRVRELGEQITRDYQGKELTFICVLKGSAFFAMDLARHVDLPLTIEFLGVSSYQGGTETTGEVRITTDVSKPMAGKHLLIIEDIIDTGLTMSFLLEKPSRARTQVPIDYKGFVIDDVFVVGYGLDYAERYRNLPFIGVMKGK